ncbi:hypothetical protein ACFLZ5_02405 [Thermodesulfobacteriota bacterium]
MFEEMVSLLKQGKFPQANLLQKRFDRAMTKKLGVIKTPYSFWSSDKKINPSTKELLWAAVLLSDKENYRMIEAIIASELEEKQRAKGLQVSIETLSDKTTQLMQDNISEFLDLAPSETFRKILQQKLLQAVTPL